MHTLHSFSDLSPFLLCHPVKWSSVSIWTLLSLPFRACDSSISVAMIKCPDKDFFREKRFLLEKYSPTWHERHGSRQKRPSGRNRKLPTYISSALRKLRMNGRWGMLWSLKLRISSNKFWPHSISECFQNLFLQLHQHVLLKGQLAFRCKCLGSVTLSLSVWPPIFPPLFHPFLIPLLRY